MAKRKYRVVGIKPPGEVDLWPIGVVRLYDCDDARLKEILDKTGTSLIELAPDAPAPVRDITVEKKKINKTNPKSE